MKETNYWSEFAKGAKNRVSIHALWQESGNQEIANADLVFGYDTMSEHLFITYGRDLINHVVENKEAVPASVLVVELDQETVELEMLEALLQVAKGKSD